MPFMTANSFFGLVPETTRGSAATINTASVGYYPIMSPQLTPEVTWLHNESFYGSPAKTYDAVPGVRSDKFSGKVYLLQDVFPNLVRAALGGNDSAASGSVSGQSASAGALAGGITAASVISLTSGSVVQYTYTASPTFVYANGATASVTSISGAASVFNLNGVIQNAASSTFQIPLASALGVASATGLTGSVQVQVGSKPAYQHVIGLANSASAGSQPPSYTLYNDSVDALYSVAGSQLVDMSISFASNAAVECTFNFVGNAASITNAASVQSATSASAFSSSYLIPAWSTSASIAGTAVTLINAATLDIKRNSAPIFTIGQQSPYKNFAGPIEVSGKLTVVVESSTATYFTNALARSQQSLTFQFTDPTATNGTGSTVTFQMTNAQFEMPLIKQDKEYVEMDLNFEAIANSTDQTAGGYSPVKAIIVNNFGFTY